MMFHVTLDGDQGDLWGVECPAVPGCITPGTTRERAVKHLKDALPPLPGSPGQARDAFHA